MFCLNPREMGKWELLLKQFWNLLWVLLIGASCLSLLQFFLDTRYFEILIF
uniref:Cation-transporting P-type ATPase N-terminal domain-containing protein n=1 Tax=Meloidogyne enterolobii TaxID=390850 RepID=A0A6V7Y1I4_MELEN|nr:unnamed protein product [Meloidogyne enterolobii]